jgi:hypothetical protein
MGTLSFRKYLPNSRYIRSTVIELKANTISLAWTNIKTIIETYIEDNSWSEEHECKDVEHFADSTIAVHARGIEDINETKSKSKCCAHINHQKWCECL